MGNTSARDTAALDRAKRDAMACDLRRAGLTYQEIADALGMSDPSVARDAIIRSRKAVIKEPATELVAWETERLDTILAAIWPKVQKGDLRAIDRVLKVMERRAKYFGLDAPEKIVHMPVSPERVTAANARRIMTELFPGDVTPNGDVKPVAAAQEQPSNDAADTFADDNEEP